MHTSDITSGEGKSLALHATGSTRAALLMACVEGIFKAMEPIDPVDIVDTDETERGFELKLDDTPHLLAKLIQEALAHSAEFHEQYTQITFGLITDKQAEGKLVGTPVKGFARTLRQPAASEISIAKREDGVWEAFIELQTA